MISFRKADINDELLLFSWKNDPVALQQSFNSNPVSLADHREWFRNKLADPNHVFYIFEQQNEAIGLVRFDRSGSETIIGIVVDPAYRGKGTGAGMLVLATEAYLAQFPDAVIHAFIKKDNFASIRSFERAGFHLQPEASPEQYQGILMIKAHVPG